MDALEDIRTITIPQAAEVLGIHPRRAYQLAERGQLPGVIRLGRSIRIRVAALRQWMEQQESQIRSDAA